jgi:hypothetical protein
VGDGVNIESGLPVSASQVRTDSHAEMIRLPSELKTRD